MASRMQSAFCAVLVTLLAAAGLPAAAQGPAKAPVARAAEARSDVSAVYEVPLYKSTIVQLRRAIKRVSVGNPGVADILVIRGSELYVVGKALGSTNVVTWDDDGRVFANFDVEVTHDLDTLKTRLHQVMPGEKIKVYSAQERLVLAGEVSSTSRMQSALDLANGFLPDCIAAESDAPVTPVTGSRSGSKAGGGTCKVGTVVNLMQVGGAQQVMLKVTVAEMARTVVKKLDSNLNFLRFGSRMAGGAVAGGASFPPALDQDGLLHPIFADPSSGFGSTGGAGPVSPIGPPVSMLNPGSPGIDSTGVFLSYLEGNNFVQAVIDISKRNGLAKILSEPTLTTLTGQQAQFLSGGEFPVPVPSGGGLNTVTIEFKEFGVGVKFLPVVLDSGRINLEVAVSVSELSSDNPVVLSTPGSNSTFVLPSLTKRSASSTVELADGQTIGVAGLISDNVREFVDKFPGLGDLPIIGALFRSQEFQSGQTELVMFVTPHLARPIAPHEMQLPTDTYQPPNDIGFYLLGSMEHRKDPPDRRGPSAAATTEAPRGSFGHDLGTAK